jgi:hypothetical protein
MLHRPREQELLQVLPARPVDRPPAQVPGDLAQVTGAGLLTGTVTAQRTDRDAQLLRQPRHHGGRDGGHIVRDEPEPRQRAQLHRHAQHVVRGSASMGKDARWLGVGAALLTGLAVLLAILAFIIYYDIFIGSASVAGYVSSLLSYSLASLVGCLLWRRPDGAGRYWFGAGVLAAVAGGGAAHLAGHLGWGHPLLFTLISDCGYAVCAACIGVAVVIVNRSARRDRRASMQE